VFEREGGGHLLEEAGALLERLHEVDLDRWFEDGDHKTGEPTTAANIDDRGRRDTLTGDAPEFERLRIVPADRIFGRDSSDTDAWRSSLDEGGMALE